MMLESRRTLLKKILFLGTYGLTSVSGFLFSSVAKALWKKENFSSDFYEETLFLLFNNREFINSNHIKLSRLPRVAENGSVVPIRITSSLKNIEKIYILVEKNPHPLIAEFYLSPSIEAQVSARFKMAKSSPVIVIVEADGKLYRKTKDITVTVGGCG